MSCPFCKLVSGLPPQHSLDGGEAVIDHFKACIPANIAINQDSQLQGPMLVIALDFIKANLTFTHWFLVHKVELYMREAIDFLEWILASGGNKASITQLYTDMESLSNEEDVPPE